MNSDRTRREAGASPTLAVLTPRWGAPSETFVRRHLTSLLPGRTVAMTRLVHHPDWCPAVPLLRIRDIPDAPWHRLARVLGRWQWDRRARALRAFLAEHSVTAVLGEWLNFSALWFKTIEDLNLNFFAHAHGYDVTQKALSRAWYRILYRRLSAMSGVITVSQLTRQRLLETFRLAPEKVHVIPCGVDVPPPLSRSEAEFIVCLGVGRLVEKKGPLITLQAFQAAHRECPRLRLELIGAGPLLPACRRYCDEQGIAAAVTFHDSRPHEFVRERLARADIFLLHSVTSRDGDEEGLPVAILEAMAHQLPVVSTRHGGIPEAVVDGRTGFLGAEHDVEAMARSIVELARQPALRRELGDAGRNRVCELFSAEQEIRRLRELIFGA